MINVSIIVPVFNGVKYIRECLNSLINQSLSNIEILVIDAGSTDGTVEIVNEYESNDSRVNLIHSDVKSMGHQYNMGICLAKGEYVGFCESDDYLALNMIEDLYFKAINNDLDYIKTDFDMFVDLERRLFLNYHVLSHSADPLYNKVICPKQYPNFIFRDVNMWNGIYKKNWLEENSIKLNETPKAAFQDTGFVLQTFLLAKKAMYIAVDGNKYRRDNINSSVYDVKSLNFVVQEFEFALDFLEKNSIDRNDEARVIILRRFFDMFCGFYDKLPNKNTYSEEITANIIKFFELFRIEYENTEYRLLNKYNFVNSLSGQFIIKNDIEKFDFLRKMASNNTKNSFYIFKTEMEKQENIVIFGSGEIGSSTCAFLLNNGLINIKAFCDNDLLKQGTELLGITIMNPNDTYKLNNVTYVIANMGKSYEIEQQLLEAGVAPQQIVNAVYTIPHLAFELKV